MEHLTDLDSDELCLEHEVTGSAIGCDGPVELYTSRSGQTRTARCRRHQEHHDNRMDELDAQLQQRYPGWDNPHSSPPPWFDPANAGETW